MKKRFIPMILVFSIILSSMISVFAESSFSDMPKTDYWSYKALNEAVNNGLIHGYNGKLNPKNNVTRAQLAAVINNAFGAKETVDTSKYKDVPSNAWYANEMGKAVNMGTITGVSINELAPLSYATRQETFCVIAKALKLNGADAQNLNKFSDKDKVASWATDSLASLVQAGYISGYGGKLNPNGIITLEELAQVMSNTIQQYFTASGEYTSVSQGNVMINTENVTLKNTKISGDLIIGDGVGNGDVTLDNVTIAGRLIARGGGSNSIKIINSSNVGSVIVGKTASGAIRIKTEEGCKVDVVYIEDGKDDVIVEGVFNQVSVKSETPVVIKNAEINVVSVSADSASVKIEGKSTVQVTEIQESANKSTIEVDKDSTVKKVNSAADDVAIDGEGKVEEANISGDNTEVNTDNTNLVVEQGTTGVIENGNPVKDTGTPVKTGTSAPISTNPPSGSGGGSSPSGGGSSTPTNPTDPTDPTDPTADTVEVINENELIEAMNSDSVYNIIIKDNIQLTKNLTITKYVEIVAGKELTVATGKNLTLDLKEYVGDNPEDENFVPGYWGSLNICGTLYIPKDSTFYNYTYTIVDGGKLKCYGNYVDISGAEGLESTKKGFLELRNSTLYNEGMFVISSGAESRNSIIQHCGGRFTNNGGLNVIGGSIASSSEFHNAGYMKIIDEYSSTDSFCDINFGNSLTDDSNWIDYTAWIYNENALYRAAQKQNEKLSALGDKEETKGFERYNRIDICKNMTINSDVTINKADVWVIDNNKDEHVELTNNATISLNNCVLHVDCKLINNGTIILGQEFNEGQRDIYGGIQVWPRGYFTNNKKVDIRNGKISRMDDLKPDGAGLKVVCAIIDGTNSLSYSDIAIVHNFEGLEYAAVTEKAIYECIEILRYEEDMDSDITLESNLDIDADMYIEWGNGIEVPEGVTLSFVGNNHCITNDADIWVYGKLNLGSNNRLDSTGKIQVGGITGQLGNKCTFTNNGFIENRNYIEVLQNGVITNNGTINNQNTIKVQDGEFNGNGVVYSDVNSINQGVTGKVFMKVYDYDQLNSALENSAINNVMISGNIDLNGDLTINKPISIGSDNESGELKTNGHTITIQSSNELQVNSGCIVINGNGKVVNQGNLAINNNGGLRIEDGGTLQTDNNITINGYLDLYNYEEADNYITGDGKIKTYSDRACFIDRTLDILYEFNDQELSVNPSALSVNAGASIASIADIQTNVTAVKDWFIGDGKNDDNTRRHYAYTAMMLNGIGVNDIADLDTPENDPYAKVTYGYAKSIFEQIATKLGLDDKQCVIDFFGQMQDNNDYIDDYGQTNSMNTLCDDFINTLNIATGKMIVSDYDELVNALSNNYVNNVIVDGNIDLNDDITLNKTLSLGGDYEYGELKTNGYTITIPDGCTLNINDGRLVINSNNDNTLNGSVLNHGIMTASVKGWIRIEDGGTLQTDTDIDIGGGLDLYNYEEADNYITGDGKIKTYSDRACFIDRTLDILYEFNDQELSVNPSALSVNAGASIAPVC